MTYESHDEQPQGTKSANNFLPISILIAAVLISGSVLYASGKGATKPVAQIPQPTAGNDQQAVAPANLAEALNIDDRDVILGDANAPVTLIEYGDYQCPFCGRMFTQVEQQLREEYINAGKVKMVFRNFQFLGSESTNAGAAAECAKDQGKFWPFHDALYTAEIEDGQENNGNLDQALFASLAEKAGLDVGALVICYENSKYVAQVEKARTDAAAIGVNSTPTSYINGQMVKGAQPYSAFKSVIDLELQKK